MNENTLCFDYEMFFTNLTESEKIKYLTYERCGGFSAMNYKLNGVELRVWSDGQIAKYVSTPNGMRLLPVFPDKRTNRIILKRSGKRHKPERIVYFAFNPHLNINNYNYVVMKHLPYNHNTYSNLYLMEKKNYYKNINGDYVLQFNYEGSYYYLLTTSNETYAIILSQIINKDPQHIIDNYKLFVCK